MFSLIRIFEVDDSKVMLKAYVCHSLDGILLVDMLKSNLYQSEYSKHKIVTFVS